MPKKIDLSGQTINRLVVIREAGRDNGGRVLWLCRCLGKNGDDCGKEVVVSGNDLRDGHTKSCGCLKRELCRERIMPRHTTHGCSRKPWYKVYYSMMERCGHRTGASERSLRDYRDRGIMVCELWQKSPQDFGNWLLAHGWRKGLQIDRIDNSLGYSPENCRVVSPKENANNRRVTLRLDDGTPLAMFCSSIGIKTREGGKVTKKYGRIYTMWSRAHKPHPELIKALKDNTDRQSRLLEITKLKIRRAELMIAAYKELLASKQTA